jgi:polo-like kinase 1
MNPTNPASSSNRDLQKDPLPDTQIIVEEKITNAMGEVVIKKYARGKFLGKGGFAKCYEFTQLESKKLSAAKIIPKASLQKSRQRAKLLSEIKIHRSLNHTNIVKLEHVFEDSENVYIILELCTNQSLNELIKRRRRLMEIEVQCYILQLINGVKYLHGNRIIHRDLKLGNFFLSDKMELKIGDFGLAAKLEFDTEKRHTVCGTPNYIAPEILENRSGHSYEVDIWSIGVIIYTLSVGRPPFETPDVKSTYKKIKMCAYSFPEHVPLSENCKSLVGKILNLDPAKRPNLPEIMNHPFISGGANIPKYLPVSTLACPPSGSYLKQYVHTDKVKNFFFQ